jgi:thiazole/oxazole-forming peptide maturase SagD family component
MFQVRILNDDLQAHIFRPRTYIVEAWIRNSSSFVGYGSHTDCDTAKQIAIAEACERLAVYTTDIPLNIGTLNASSRRIDPRGLMPLTAEQRQHVYLADFNPDLEYRWITAQEIISRSQVELIADCCLFSLSAIWPNGRVAWANSNGMAAGYTYERAEQSALLELFERDALMNIWMSRFSPPRIDNQLLPDEAASIQDSLAVTGYQFVTLNATCRQVPVVIILASRDQRPALILTAAARFTLTDAIIAAWHELETEISIRLLHERLSDQPTPGLKLPITQVRSHADHTKFYAEPDNQSYADFLWQNHSTSRPPCVETMSPIPASKGWNLRECCLNLSLNQVYYLDYGLVHGHHVIRLASPNLVPLMFGYNQFPLAHQARKTCGINHSVSCWNGPVPPHPLD